jgi:hypothetical protein
MKSALGVKTDLCVGKRCLTFASIGSHCPNMLAVSLQG